MELTPKILSYGFLVVIAGIFGALILPEIISGGLLNDTELNTTFGLITLIFVIFVLLSSIVGVYNE